MYMVYWNQGSTAHSRLFHTEQFLEHLSFSESLRKRKLQGEDIGFITTAVEHPDCVGQMGVDVTGPDYNWRKRR